MINVKHDTDGKIYYIDDSGIMHWMMEVEIHEGDMVAKAINDILHSTEKHFNLNYDIVIYPNANGWLKMREIISQKYNISITDAQIKLKNNTTYDCGYKDSLWVIASDFHDMFFVGQNYFKTMNIKLMNI